MRFAVPIGTLLAGLLLGAVAAGVGAGYYGFEAGREYERGLGRLAKPCECRKCRCMTGGVPGDAAGAVDGSVE